MRKHGFLVVVGILLFAGCRTHNMHRAFVPESAITQQPLAPAIYVNPPTENRPLRGRSQVGKGLVILIPLWPYGRQVIAPEYVMRGGWAKYAYTFPRDLQMTVVKDLAASGLAEKVEPLSSPFSEAGAGLPPGTRILDIRLDEGVQNRKITLYGLSLVGGFLVLFGVPVGFGEFDLQFTVDVKDATGRVLATRSFAGSEDYIETLYNMQTSIRAMPKAYRVVSKDLRRFIADNL